MKKEHLKIEKQRCFEGVIMKTVKKLVFVMAVLMAFGAFAGCYVVNGGPIDKVKGTYILDVYSRSYPPKEGEEEGEKHDYIKERNIVEYIVINEDGTGYLVSKEGDGEIDAVEVAFTFDYSEEEPEKITYVKFKGSITGQESFGVHTKKMFGDTTLNVTFPNIFGRKYTETFKYKRVNNKTDLSYVKKKMGDFTVREAVEEN